MAKKWVCDKCGKQFTKENREDGSPNLWELRYNEWIESIADVCDNCRVKLDAVINEFFGRKVVEMEKEVC